MRSKVSRRSRYGLVSLVVGGVAAAAVFVQSAGATVTTYATFTTPGTYTWTVPTGVTSVTFSVYGASGGGVVSVNHQVVTVISQGGGGGEAKGKFAVKAGETFEIKVGSQGGASSNGSQGLGGIPGGGTAYGAGGGGGGESDVRIGGRGSTCASSARQSCGTQDRIIVAGGGGGGDSAAENGLNGGGVTGSGNVCNVAVNGTSASQDCAGVWSACVSGGVTHPGLGQGGDGCAGTPPNPFGGAGGGGWYGGGNYHGGGGGSGYVSQLAKSSSFPTATNTGDGKVIITS